VRRLDVVQEVITCPAQNRAVRASRNRAAGRLVDCSEKDACRTSDDAAGDGPYAAARPFPRGCPVFPHLAR
jgi:hypothetical protein